MAISYKWPDQQAANYTQGIINGMEMYDRQLLCVHCGDSERAHVVKSSYDGATDTPYNTIKCTVINCQCHYILRESDRGSRFVPRDIDGNKLQFESAKTKIPMDETIDPMKLTFESAIAVVKNHNNLILDLRAKIADLESKIMDVESTKSDYISIIKTLRQGSCDPEAPCDLVENGAIGNYVCNYHA